MGILLYLGGFVIAYVFQYIDFTYFKKVQWTIGMRTNAIRTALLSWIIVFIGIFYLGNKWFCELKKSNKPSSW
jgi:hypothetical protein